MQEHKLADVDKASRTNATATTLSPPDQAVAEGWACILSIGRRCFVFVQSDVDLLRLAVNCSACSPAIMSWLAVRPNSPMAHVAALLCSHHPCISIRSSLRA